MQPSTLIIATRESPLALRQAELVRQALQQQHPGLACELLGLTTVADKRLEVTLTQIGGKGLFVQELEEALLNKTAHIAVHSMKDVPMQLPPGLVLPAMLPRDDPRDAFVSKEASTLFLLPAAARLGTASLRRQTQLRALHADLRYENLRGNLQTRLQRLDHGDFNALILAAAGLKRMGFTARIADYLSPEQSLPAAGQGAIGIECRADDRSTQALLAPLNDPHTFACVSAERAVCRELNGGCQVPLAAFAMQEGKELWLRGLVANRAGTRLLRAEQKGELDNAEKLGQQVAKLLVAQGAHDLLREFYAD